MEKWRPEVYKRAAAIQSACNWITRQQPRNNKETIRRAVREIARHLYAAEKILDNAPK